VTPTLSAAATIAGDSVAAAQLLLGVTVLPPWTSRAPIDFGAVIALYGIAAGDRGQSRAVYARQHLVNEHGGYWAGAAIGQIDRTASFASNAFDVGAWITQGRGRYTATLSTTSTDDHDVFLHTSLKLHPFVEQVRVADAAVTAEFLGETFNMEASVGARFAVKGLDGSRAFASLAVGARVTRLARLVVSFGNQLADPLRGTPEWRYASLGLRFANAPSRAGFPRGRSGPALLAARLDDGRVRITVAAPATAQRVEIAGTLTGWDPVPLVRGAAGWETTLTLPPGAYRVQVRLNRGDWRVPGNLTVVSDEFGQRAGLIIVQ
jgi:hypothetical protein